MKLLNCCIYILFIVTACKYQVRNKEKEQIYEKSITESYSIPQKYVGNFKTYVEIEETTTGISYITYYFNINKKKIVLTTNTYHEPILCNGNYFGREKNGLLELYYNGKENACLSKKSSFDIKNKGDKFFIKGVGGENKNKEWIELEKI